MTDQGFDEQCSNDPDRCRCPDCREQFFQRERSRKTNAPRRIHMPKPEAA